MEPVVLTRGNSVAGFFGTYLHHTKGARAGEAFLLEPWQQRFVDEFYRVDKNGKRVYRLGILGVPRGNGKTPLAAGFGLFELMSRKDSPDVFCAAGSKEQAQLITDFARAFVDTGKLRSLGVKARRRSIVFEQTSAVMRVLSSEGSLQHGLSVSAAIADELHAFTSEAQEEVWTALWTALHKRPNSFALVITTAGFDKDTLLGRMYDAALEMPDADDSTPCLRIRRDLEHGVLFYWYGIPEAREDDWQDTELWRQANPASWITVGELADQLHAPGVDEYDFKRLHLNMWTRARDSWLPAGVWAGLADKACVIPLGGEVYAGVDVGWSHDSTAVALAHRQADGRIVLRVKVWTTDPEAEGQFVAGGSMQLSLIADHLRQVKKDYKLKEVSYDPKFFGPIAQDLEQEGFLMVEMLPSSAPMQNGWQTFYQAAMEGSIVHDGDKTLSNHVEAAAADKTEQGWKVRKLKSTSRIDALAASVMAHARCALMSKMKQGPQIFWLD